MDVVPLGPGFAAELRGVTLADVASDDAAYAAARAAFEEHSVLVFRGQEVTDELQLAFSRRFGPPEVTKVGSQGTGSHFVILSTIGPDGKVVPPDHRLSLRSKANQLWHTDSSFKRVPALTSILSARIIPARGGETEYVSTRLAFERLDASQRKKLENSFAWHDYAHSRGQIASDLASPEERAALPPQCWRMVWKNPVNGRGAIYLASHAYGHGAGGGKKPDRRTDASGNLAGDELPAPMAQRRRRDVGQPRDHASRPAMAGTRAAPDDPHHDLRDRGRRRRYHAPAVIAGGGVAAP
jgi:alpha-ketoglutarate-dependent 2,4-dichlorophenoxyacetate dioxygenase